MTRKQWLLYGLAAGAVYGLMRLLPRPLGRAAADLVILVLFTDGLPSYALLFAGIPAGLAMLANGYGLLAVWACLSQGGEAWLAGTLTGRGWKNAMICLLTGAVMAGWYLCSDGLIFGWDVGLASLWQTLGYQAAAGALAMLLNHWLAPLKRRLAQ